MLLALKGLCDMVPGWLWAIFCAGLLGTSCAQQVVIERQQHNLGKLKLQYAEEKASREKAVREATTLYRNVERVRESAAVEIRDAVILEKRKVADLVRAGDAERRVLLAETARLSAGSGAAPGDTAALARAEGRAKAFGELLGQCDGVAEGLAREAEDLAGIVRGLQRAYNSLLLPATVSDPLPDRRQADPSPALVWNVVVHTPLPDLAGDAGFDARTSLAWK